ncbi:uncharacterized protein LOC131672593 [Phymastichus coffea]|uniref:uncharacterized protein LOC131672593 n=1 Tax=Phymastichus coffea TaxID=108790 RepID=UPI00273B5BDA|nr:uncharacterized protein LOC131672593 [Phymastichus coffea]
MNLEERAIEYETYISQFDSDSEDDEIVKKLKYNGLFSEEDDHGFIHVLPGIVPGYFKQCGSKPKDGQTIYNNNMEQHNSIVSGMQALSCNIIQRLVSAPRNPPGRTCCRPRVCRKNRRPARRTPNTASATDNTQAPGPSSSPVEADEMQPREQTPMDPSTGTIRKVLKPKNKKNKKTHDD